MPLPRRVSLPITRSQARAADRRAEEVLGVPAAVLMENAGRGLADVTEEDTKCYGCDEVAVLVARGNNGGDGLVAARHLFLRGLAVRVLLATGEAGFDPETPPGVNLRAARASGIQVLDASGSASLEAASRSLGPGVLLVDAVLGTGLEGSVRGHLRAVLEWMRGSGRPVVAADLPSGLDADTGAERGPVPRCVTTATFLAPKVGLTVGRGPALAGRVVVCDIGVPWEAVVEA